MQTAANIISFRELLRTQYPQAHAVTPLRDKLETGVPCLDATGLYAGAVCEIVASCGSTGAGLLLTTLLEGANETLRQPVALVDGADVFDPRCVSVAARERLLWLRCRNPELAMRLTDLLLRDGNIPRVLLDLQLCPARSVRQIPAHAWHRMRLLAEKSGAVLCAFTAFQTVPCARSRLVLERSLSLDALDAPRGALVARLDGRSVRRSMTAMDGVKFREAV